MSDQPLPPETSGPPVPTPTAPPPAADHVVSTTHQLGIGRTRLKYTATTGRIVLREEVITDGTFTGHLPRAEVFHTAYTLDDADPGTRPVTFAFNGGPGSSSVWLHLGLLGPRRVVMGDAGHLAKPPYGLTDNLQTLLTVSDLVFIDPVTTGYSRAVSGHRSDDFHGFTRDLESVSEFIRLWTSREGRWLSPKFLAGESYGTTRAAALSNHLAQTHGMYLNGIMLISSVLDMSSVHFSPGNDVPYTTFFPTYVAAAHFHSKITGGLKTRLREAEAFAARDLPWAIARGARLVGKERAEIVARYAELTGLSPDYVDRADLKIDLFGFCAELLRDRGLALGRLDLRFTGPMENANAARISHDPSYSAILGPYAAAFNGYVRGELGYASDLTYNILTGKVHPWSYKEFEGSSVEVLGALSQAMRDNEHLRVHIDCGYYDGATPYFAAEHVLARLGIPVSDRDRLEWAYYEAGHMMYVHEGSRLAESERLADFVRRTSTS